MSRGSCVSDRASAIASWIGESARAGHRALDQMRAAEVTVIESGAIGS